MRRALVVSALLAAGCRAPEVTLLAFSPAQGVALPSQEIPVQACASDAAGTALPGLSLTFAATGGALLASDDSEVPRQSVSTDASGCAVVVARAPEEAGWMQLSASAPASSAAFALVEVFEHESLQIQLSPRSRYLGPDGGSSDFEVVVTGTDGAFIGGLPLLFEHVNGALSDSTAQTSQGSDPAGGSFSTTRDARLCVSLPRFSDVGAVSECAAPDEASRCGGEALDTGAAAELCDDAVFTVERPDITAAFPTRIIYAEGASADVALYGSGFGASPVVHFNGQAATVSYSDATQVHFSFVMTPSTVVTADLTRTELFNPASGYATSSGLGPVLTSAFAAEPPGVHQ